MKTYLENKIKILYLHAGAELYGADKVLLELVSNLDSKYFKPIVILPNKGPLLEKLQNNNIETHVIQYPILRRKFFNFKGLIKFSKDYKYFSKELDDFVKKNKINIVHVNTAAVLEGIYLKRKNKIPLVWHIHEIIVSPKIVFYGTSALIGTFATKVVTVSQAVKKHLVSSKLVSDNKVEVIYNGVKGENFENIDSTQLKNKLGIKRNENIVGMIGRINSWKGQDDFLESMEPLLSKYPDLKLLIIGGVFEGEEWRLFKLQEKIKKSKNANRIILIDFQDNIEDYYNIMDIFVLPSTNPDPLPTVVLEAMASSRPVVGYKHGGIAEMIVDSEWLLAEVNNIEELGEIVEKLLLNPELQSEIGNKNKKRQVEFFNKEMYAKNFENLYKNTIEEKNVKKG